jgi:hypothetical protein
MIDTMVLIYAMPLMLLCFLWYTCNVSLLSLILIVLVKSSAVAFRYDEEAVILESCSVWDRAGRRTMESITR